MATIGADGLSLLVGDGATTELFNALKGSAVTRLEVTQRGHVANAIASDAWQTLVSTSNRNVVIESECYATDDAPALRIKALALSGVAANFKLQLRGAETLVLSAFVMQYREDIAAGDIKRMRFRLESNGAASLA
jgi:hypothetical protein